MRNILIISANTHLSISKCLRQLSLRWQLSCFKVRLDRFKGRNSKRRGNIQSSFFFFFSFFVLVLILQCLIFQGVNFLRNSLLLYGEWDKDVQPIRLWDRRFWSFPKDTFPEITTVLSQDTRIEWFIRPGLAGSNIFLHLHGSCLSCDLCRDLLLRILLQQPLYMRAPPVTSMQLSAAATLESPLSDEHHYSVYGTSHLWA